MIQLSVLLQFSPDVTGISFSSVGKQLKMEENEATLQNTVIRFESGKVKLEKQDEQMSCWRNEYGNKLSVLGNNC